MADPISLTASILTLTDAAVGIGKFIARCRDAPAEVLALNNEVNDLRFVLGRVADMYPRDAESNMTATLHRAGEKITDLHAVVHQLRLKEGATLSTADRIRWTMMKSKVRRLHTELRYVRLHLNTLLITETANGAHHACLAVEHLCLVSQVTSQDSKDLHQALAAQLQLLKSIQENQSRIHEAKQLNIESARGFEPEDQNGTISTLAVIPPDARDTEQHQSNHTVSVSVQEFQSCGQSCDCICHKQSRLSTPYSLNNLFGYLFLGYQGSPFSKINCTIGSCKSAASVPVVRLTYYFPQWFLANAIDLMFLRGCFGEPSASIAIRNVRDRDDDVFKAVYKGNIARLQEMFSGGEARPSDIDQFGHTLVTRAVARWNSETCRFLVNVGVDPYYQNVFGVSAFDSAWKQILTSDTSPQAQELATVFSDKERLDAWNMSSLHKIVFKLSCRNLQEKLQEVQLNLNAPDANGRTPLWWAAARGDKDAVKTLLDHGADIDISDCEGDPPLHAAMFSTQRQDVVNLLLEYGASTTQRNKRGCMTLHHAAHHHNDISYVMPLIRPDMDINTRAGPFGETPLAIASRKDHFRVVKYLLDHGADVNLANKEDNTPLMECVYFGRHRTLSILLSHGAALTPKTKRGETILHMAALYCDKETLDLLASYNAACIVDLKAKTKAGLTVFDLVARRVWLNGEREAFIKLLLTNSSARSTFDEGFLEGWPHPTRSLESGQLGQRRECIEDDTEEEWYDC